VIATVLCNGNTAQATNLSVATANTLVTHDATNSPYPLTLNAPTNVCATSGAASNLGAVTCFGGNNGSATITMSPTPSNTSITYSVDGGAATPATLVAGAFNVTGLTAGAHSIVVTNPSCSNVTVPVTISGPSGPLTNTTTQTSCDSFLWSVTGSTYTESGTYTGTSTNGNGCTVAETLVLTINQSTSSTETISACSSYTWAANDQTYTESGTYVVNGTNAAGCPDTKTLVLTINQPTSNTTPNLLVIPSPGQLLGKWPDVYLKHYGEQCLYQRPRMSAHRDLGVDHQPEHYLKRGVSACNSYTWAANSQTYTERYLHGYHHQCGRMP
jgi:hypothetical protein